MRNREPIPTRKLRVALAAAAFSASFLTVSGMVAQELASTGVLGPSPSPAAQTVAANRSGPSLLIIAADQPGNRCGEWFSTMRAVSASDATLLANGERSTSCTAQGNRLEAVLSWR